MPAPWHTRRRADRYSPREHDVHSQRDRGVVAEPISVVPEAVTWKIAPGADIAHAFSTVPGWMRSVCRGERWTVLLNEAADGATQCFECADILAGEIPELELRAMDGGR